MLGIKNGRQPQLDNTLILARRTPFSQASAGPKNGRQVTLAFHTTDHRVGLNPPEPLADSRQA